VLQDGVAVFNRVQIFDAAQTNNIEVLRVVDDDDCYTLEMGKNATRVAASVRFPRPTVSEANRDRTGDYFYLYSKPLVNYYHTIADGLGCIHRYLELREVMPEMVLLINSTPRMGLEKYPPFAIELLEAFSITWEYTQQDTVYERVYFGDTLCNDPDTGKRIRPYGGFYDSLETLVELSQTANAPDIEKIYLSRRTSSNPQYTKSLIGEDNTQKRGLVNETEVVEILSAQGYTEVFGENYTLCEKIKMFSSMDYYVSSAGAGVTNCVYKRQGKLIVGGVHTPGFPFPGANHSRHMCTTGVADIRIYPGKTVFEDPQPTRGYNHPWRVNNLVAFEKWVKHTLV
jgi:hypothetical protein